MNNNLINKYEINFINKVINFHTRGNEVRKIMNTSNPYLSEFLDAWTAEDITNYLLIEMDKVFNGIEEELETGSETISVSLYKDKVDFYDNDFNYIGNIPTKDFKEICEGWRDFLITPPLNGTKIPSKYSFE